MVQKLPVGIQVYGLRDKLENTPENFREVMQEVKDMGYEGVELAGLYKIPAEEIKRTLDEVGLIPISAHVPFADMRADIEKVVADYTTIGVKYIAVPYLDEEDRPLQRNYEQALADMKKAADRLEQAGIRLQYHNHNFEFVKMANGEWGYDDMFDKVPNLIPEEDLCWINVAGCKPADYVKKYEGRGEVLHFKDFIKEGSPKNMFKLIGIESEEEENDTGFFEFHPVGFGQQIWEPIMKQAVESGWKWVIVEQDEHYELDCMEAARRSREYLKILGW